MNILKWIFGIILFLALITLGVWFLFYIQYEQIKPGYPEKVKLEGLLRPANIEIDSGGVPHIYAQTEQDLITVMGYFVAIDHLWEMELMRRAGQGRLSEIFGKRTLEFDLMFRNLQIDSLSAYLYQNISEDSKNWLAWYTRGINQSILERRDNLPVEFQLMEFRPEPWKPRDVLLVYRFIGWMLDKSWKIEYFFARATTQLSPHLTREIWPQQKSSPKFQQGYEKAIEPVNMLWEIDKKFREWWGIRWKRFGEHGWVVGGEHTASNRPILVNEEPFGSGRPFDWVEIHLSSPEINAAGFAIPGVPGIVIGKNNNISWGAVSIPLEETNFSIENINPAGNKDEKVALGYHKENIRVRDEAKTYTLLIYKAFQKLVLKPSLEDIQSGPMVSLEWAGWNFSDEVLSLKLLAKAENWQGFREAISHFKVPALSFVFASENGDIGAQLAANVTIKNEPQKPSSATAKFNTGEGRNFFLFDQLPFLSNPRGNWLNALDLKDNSNFLDPSIIPSGVENPLKESTDKQIISIDSINSDLFSKMDSNSENVKRLSSWMDIITTQKFLNDSQLVGDIQWILEKWNGEMHYDSVPTLVYQVWEFFIITNIFADQMGTELFDLFIETPGTYLPAFYRVISKKGSAWFDNYASPYTIETRESVIVKSFEETIEFLKNSLGDEIYRWQWRNFSNYLNNQHALSNTLVNYLLQQAPVRIRKNGISSHFQNLKREISVVTNEFRDRTVISMDWQENNHYLSINSKQLSLGLELAFPEKQIDPELKNNLKRVILEKSYKPLLNIGIEPK